MAGLVERVATTGPAGKLSANNGKIGRPIDAGRGIKNVNRSIGRVGLDEPGTRNNGLGRIPSNRGQSQEGITKCHQPCWLKA